MFRESNAEEEFSESTSKIQLNITENHKKVISLFSDKKSKRVPAVTVLRGKWYVTDTSYTLLVLKNIQLQYSEIFMQAVHHTCYICIRLHSHLGFRRMLEGYRNVLLFPSPEE